MVGYRKFTACLLAMLLASALVWLGKIGDQVYATVMVASVGAYLAANTMAKAKATVGQS